MTTKVKLRQKSISEDRKSLYLDFYPAIISPKTGKPTRREFLKLYVFESDKKTNKKHNEETLQIAELIRQKREYTLNKPEIYSEYEKEKLRLKELGENNFVEYFFELAKKRKGSTASNWNSAYKYLKVFTGGSLKFKDLNEKWAEEFKDHLLTVKSRKSKKVKLSQNSANSYFNKVKATLKQAYQDGIIQKDLNSRIKPIGEEETLRNFLTIEELNKLVQTPCNNILLKNAALFSALTGLAFADISKMIWSDLEFIKEQGYFLKYRRKKTKSVDYLPISEQAVKLMGVKGNPDDKIFDGLKYSAYQNKHLYQWIGASGITKDITFHCFRHTYATLQLFNGTSPTILKEMMRHKNLKTTMIYAKIVDKSKQEAVNKIRLDL